MPFARRDVLVPTYDNDDMPRGDPDLVIEAYKKDIDRTLIRENLKLSVEDRFRKAMALARFAEELRRAGKASRKQQP
jgi:hypothetical protein